MRGTISNILIIVFSAIIAFSGFRLYTIFHEYHEGEKQYEETASSFVEKKQEHTQDPVNITGDTGPQVCPISVDFDGLIAANSDVVGWIYIPGTVIDYPVLWREEDNDFYLHHDIDGKESYDGVFLDVPKLKFEQRKTLTALSVGAA